MKKKIMQMEQTGTSVKESTERVVNDITEQLKAKKLAILDWRMGSFRETVKDCLDSKKFEDDTYSAIIEIAADSLEGSHEKARKYLQQDYVEKAEASKTIADIAFKIYKSAQPFGVFPFHFWKEQSISEMMEQALMREQDLIRKKFLEFLIEEDA